VTLAIVAFIVAAMAAAFSGWQARESRRANAFPAVVDLFREYRSPEMVAARRLVSRELGPDRPACEVSDLPDELAQAVLRIGHYLDNIGVMIDKKLIKPELVAGFLGDSALRQWNQMERFIRKERLIREPSAYMNYFEHLAVTLLVVRPEDVRAKLRKMPSPSEE
jgi:hypothetical protein